MHTYAASLRKHRCDRTIRCHPYFLTSFVLFPYKCIPLALSSLHCTFAVLPHRYHTCQALFRRVYYAQTVAAPNHCEFFYQRQAVLARHDSQSPNTSCLSGYNNRTILFACSSLSPHPSSLLSQNLFLWFSTSRLRRGQTYYSDSARCNTSTS